jgi:hypothetical protein
LTVRNLFELYKQGIGADRRIILCNRESQDGFEIRNLTDFEQIVERFDDRELFIQSQQENDDLLFFEYFEMNKTKPSVVIIRHPHIMNAYHKEKPDRIIDICTIDFHIYRFISVDYGWLLKENIIELPTNVDTKVWKFLQKRFPKAFYNNVKDTDSSFSIIFTNTDRFTGTDEFSFKTYTLSDLYPNLKAPSLKGVSEKFWKELKAFSNK